MIYTQNSILLKKKKKKKNYEKFNISLVLNILEISFKFK